MQMPGPDSRVTSPDQCERLMEGPLGAILLVAEDRFSVVDHSIAPRTLGAPVHTHRNEDEYAFVQEGTVGVEIDGETFEASAGSVVVKPRGIQHAFWNATDEPARLLELIVPGGFERYFTELGEILGRPGPPDVAALGELAAQYDLEVDPASIPRLAADHGLVLPG
jgi:quercetin dioxygenase-like cupin family protein